MRFSAHSAVHTESATTQSETKPIRSLQHELESQLRSRGLSGVLDIHFLQKHWSVVVGKPLALETRPHKLVGHTLLIHVADAAYSEFFRVRESQIVKNINRSMQSDRIRQLRFATRYFPPNFSPTAKGQPATEPNSENKCVEVRADGAEYNALPKQIDSCSHTISDIKLRDLFAGYMRASIKKQDGLKKDNSTNALASHINESSPMQAHRFLLEHEDSDSLPNTSAEDIQI